MLWSFRIYAANQHENDENDDSANIVCNTVRLLARTKMIAEDQDKWSSP